MGDECTEKQRITKIEDRLGKGDTELALLNVQASKTHELVENINKRLFIDNGTKCVQTRIDRMEVIARVLIWMCSVLTVATVGLISKLIYLAVTT